MSAYIAKKKIIMLIINVDIRCIYVYILFICMYVLIYIVIVYIRNIPDGEIDNFALCNQMETQGTSLPKLQPTFLKAQHRPCYYGMFCRFQNKI